MGLLSIISGEKPGNLAQNSGGSGLAQGNHKLDIASVIANDNNAITPENVSFKGKRSTPVLKESRSFNKQEQITLSAYRKQRQNEAESTELALKDLGAIDDADLREHKAFQRYQRKLGRNNLERVESNVSTAKTFHGLRGGYVQAGLDVGVAQQKADAHIDAIKASYGAV